MPRYDVIAICNALMDLLIETDESTIQELGMTKGIMHLVDGTRQNEILDALKGKQLTYSLGGSSLNAIRSISSLGASTGFIGKIGDDEFASILTGKMKDMGITTSLGRSSSEPTGSCIVLVTPDGERTMNTCLGASRLYDHNDIDFEMIKETKILHFCGYQWDTDSQKEAIYKAIKVGKEAGAQISFDVADPFVVDRNKDDFLNLIKEFADVVFANQKEAEMLFGESPRDAAKKIDELGATAVVKLGAEGAVVQKNGESYEIPAVQTTVVDTTAAGDMFAGGFLFGLAKNRPLDVCGAMAANLAACVISRVGTEVSDATYERVKTL